MVAYGRSTHPTSSVPSVSPWRVLRRFPPAALTRASPRRPPAARSGRRKARPPRMRRRGGESLATSARCGCPRGRPGFPPWPTGPAAPRRPLGRGGHQDAVVRRSGRPAERAVAGQQGDVPIAQLAEHRAGAGGKLGVALDADDLAGQLGQHGRLITAAGADLQHLLAAGELQRLGHQRDHVRLADRLAAVDGQGAVGVSLVAEGRGDELFAGHAGHGRQHPRIADPPPSQLPLDHLPPGVCEVD